jgi:hypothetical protein
MGTSNPNTDTYHALLNIAQCQQLGASTDTQTVTDNFLAGGTNDFQFGWTTHTRGLNRTTLTAGIYSVSALVQIQPSVIGSITQLLAHLSVYHVDDSVSSPFMILTSSPIDNTRPFGSEVITFQALLVADVTIAETDELQLEFFGHTDSSVDPIFITLTLQAPNRPTFLEVPFQMSVTGVATGNHQQLSARDQDVASADPVKADPCHPYNALGPAGRHFHRVAAGAVASNILTFPADASTCVVTLTADLTLDGIDATGFLPADTSVECPVSIVFVTGGHTLTVRSGQGVTSPAESIQLVTASGVTKSWGGTRRCRLQLVHNSATHTWDETSRSIY